MTKQAFIEELRKGLSGLPQVDSDERIIFYSEMIDDMMEEGLTEEAAISKIGDVGEIVSQIMSEISSSSPVKEKVKPKRGLKIWKIVLLVLSSPIWLPLLIAVAIVLLSMYVVIWAVLLSLYITDFAFAVCGLAGILGVVVYISLGNLAGAFCSVGAGLVCGGISILLFFGCNQFAKGVLLLTKKIFRVIKSCFIGKGDEK